MKRVAIAAIAVMAAVALAACGEKPQTLSSPQRDTQPYSGTGSAFTADGWKQGDKTSWEQHLKTRMQNSQNDYSRMN